MTEQDVIKNTDMLFILIRNHKWKKIKKILETSSSKYDINISDNYGNYLLTYAVRYNKKNIVNMLINLGARCDIVDKHSKCILYDPIESNYVDIIKLILDKSKLSVGIDIVNIKDSSGNIPLHYAIFNNNIELVKLLLEYKSNPNIKDNLGYNALHIATKKMHINMVELLLPFMSNINAVTNNGETALHIALNYGSDQICTLLLDNNAICDIAETDHELTPLHYAVGLNNITIVQRLLQKTNINVQDMHGNTPIMHAIKENNYECFCLLVKHQQIDVNKWNVYGKQALHEVFELERSEQEKYIDLLINLSDVSFQDAYGNTGLHYLVLNNIWHKYIDSLTTKKLNIFIKNSNNLTVVDIVAKSDKYDLFIEMVAKSYIFLLKAGAKWEDNVDQLCSKTLAELTANEKTQLQSLSNNNVALDTVCVNLIKDKLTHNILNIQNGSKNQYYSFPFNQSNLIRIDEYDMLNICTFTGTHLDILIGLLYLIKKHDNTNAPISLRNNTKTLHDMYTLHGITKSNKCDFINFEMLWIGGHNLYALDNFSSVFSKCTQQFRFIIVPLGIEMQTGAHSNYLIYDKETHEIERFEPHGSAPPIGFNYNPSFLDKTLLDYFKTVDKNITYISPSAYMPRIAFQIMDEQETKKRKIGDPGGFCALWSMWYVDQRITHCKIDRKTLVLSLIETIKNNQISFRNMIRNYSRYIINYRDELLLKVNLTINEWINNDYTDAQLDKFNSILIQEIHKIKC